MSVVVRDAPTWFANEPVVTAASAERTGTTYLEALRWALEDELAGDDRVVLLGEDIATMGGAFRVTQGLLERFGEQRVIDTPIAEAALVGAGPFHSQSPEGVFAHIPGLKVVCPGTPQDAYDLLRAAVADPNPVLLFEHKGLYRSQRETVVRGGPVGALGTALVRRPGDDVTVVTYGGMVPRCLAAAEAASATGLEAEVVDLRTVHPFDTATVVESVRRTGRVVVVHEDTGTSGIGAEVAARIADLAFYDLDAPVRRVTAPDTPVPFALPLEEGYVPSVERIQAALEEVGRC
jgi:pyruvate/2-oxoglutarate/acetoin dehydrogenase E1 component